jgi:hypothetical protein
MTTLAKNIVVKISTIYGKDVIIPVCVNARTFAEIAGTKQLTKNTINMIKSLGYHVNIKQEIKTLNDVEY